MKERNQKGSSADRVSTPAVDRPAPLRTPLLSAPAVSDSPSTTCTNTWRRYCDDRLRHFAAGR
jgi:hypothetical protein